VHVRRTVPPFVSEPVLVLRVYPRIYPRFFGQSAYRRAQLCIQVGCVLAAGYVVYGHEATLNLGYFLERIVLDLLSDARSGFDLCEGIGYMRAFVPVARFWRLIA